MKKLYTPEQRKEKQRERSRNYQKKRTMQKRIVRYSCFLIQQGYTILMNKEFDGIMKKIRNWKIGAFCSLALNIILLVLLLILK